MVVILLYNMADTFFVGQTGDEMQVAAVSLATPVFLLFMAIGSLFGIGGTSVISRALGKKDEVYARQVSSFCFWFSIIVGVFFIILFQSFMSLILKIIGASANTVDYARSYLNIVSWSAPFVLVSTAFSNIVRAEGRSNEAMIGTMTGTILNIVLDPIMILVLKIGISGAAWATVIGNVISSIYYIVILIRSNTHLSISVKDLVVNKSIIYDVFSIGIPASLQSIMMSVSSIVINLFLVAYGDIQLAAYGVAVKLAMITGLVQIGLGQGIQPILGYNYGARKPERFMSVVHYSDKLSIVMGIILTAVCWIFAGQMTRMFIDSQEIIQYGVPFLKTLLISGPILGILFVYINALQAIGSSKYSLILSISRQGLIFIPLLFIFNKLFGLDGLVFSQPIADILSCILSVFLFKKEKKMIFSNSPA